LGVAGDASTAAEGARAEPGDCPPLATIDSTALYGRTCEDGGVVLRSMRYGEPTASCTCTTPTRTDQRDRQGRQTHAQPLRGPSGAVLPLRMDLHEGRGELLTVTGAHTVDAYPRLRGDARALDSAARACDAVGRLFETGEPHPGVFNLLCRHLGLLDEQVSGTARPTGQPTATTGESPDLPRPAARPVAVPAPWRSA